jgi:uncharacterized protein
MVKSGLKFVVILIGLLFFIGQAYAAEVHALYSVKLPVNSHAEKERLSLLVKAFGKVLTKVSGNSNITSAEQISSILPKANSYVKEYSYTKQDDKPNAPLLLKVTFSSSAVKKLLRESNYPIWSSQRPLSLVWIVADDGTGRRVILNDSDNEIVKAVKEQASLRGLPIIFPLLDLTDLQQVTANDVWAPFITVLTRVSQRYNADDVLIIRIDAGDGKETTAHWTLLLNDEQTTWNIEEKDLSTAIKAGIDEATDRLAKKFVAVSAVQKGDVLLEVSNLNDITAYAKVMQYLKKLAAVSNVEALSVSSEAASFHLTLSGDIDGLKKEIGLGSFLEFKQQKEELEQGRQILQYQYNAEFNAEALV